MVVGGGRRWQPWHQKDSRRLRGRHPKEHAVFSGTLNGEVAAAPVPDCNVSCSRERHQQQGLDGIVGQLLRRTRPLEAPELGVPEF